MNKNLVLSDQEFVDLFVSSIAADISVEELENFLGCYFAFADGTFLFGEDDLWNKDADGNQGVDFKNFKKNNRNNFPKKYPCVVVWEYKSLLDNCGSVKIGFISHVYLDDFNCENMELFPNIFIKDYL